MVHFISIVSFVFICIFSYLITPVAICPVYAGELIVDNTKKTDQTASRDSGVKGIQQQEFIKTKGLEYITTKKDPKPQGASYIRLKPKLEDNGAAGLQKIFDIEFMGDETSKQKAKKDADSGPYVKFEKIDDPEKNNILIRQTTEKNYKTEVSMGLKTSPYSEISLGKGFLVERKDDLNVGSRDNGWRIKFKFDF